MKLKQLNKEKKVDAFVKEVPAGFKLYQQEVDQLNNRALDAEEKLIDVLQTVVKPALQEREQVQEEFDVFKAEHAELIDQSVSLARLQAELKKTKETMAEMVQQEVELVNEQAEQHQLIQERRIRELERELQTCQRNYSDAQQRLFALTNDQQAQAEKQSLLDQLEDLQQELMATKAELETHQKREASSNMAQSTAAASAADVSSAVTVVHKDLEMELDKQLMKVSTLNEQNALLEREIDVQNETMKKMKKTVQQLKKELSVARKERAASPAAATSPSPSSSSSATSSSMIPIMNELKDRLQTLETELAAKKSQIHALSIDVQEKDRQLESEREQKHALMQTIESIENDHKENISTSSISTSTSTNASSTSPSNGNDLFLQTVLVQRDQWKRECERASAAAALAERREQEAKETAARIERENTVLYNKIAYLSSFNDVSRRTTATTTTAASSVSSAMGLTSDSVAIDVGGGGSSSSSGNSETDKYKEKYEQTLDPFKRFQQTEKEKRYQRLGALEKLVFLSSSLLLSNRVTRMFVLIYSFSLHFLVFFVLWRSTHHISVCKQ